MTATPASIFQDSYKTDKGGFRKHGIFAVTFSDTYNAGGETVNLSAFFRTIQVANVISNSGLGAGLVFDIDATNFGTGSFKVEINRVAAHTHDLFLNNADVVDGAGTRVNAGADLLGANTGGDLTVTGLAAGGSAHGGVLGIAEANLSEMTAGTSLTNLVAYVEVWGF